MGSTAELTGGQQGDSGGTRTVGGQSVPRDSKTLWLDVQQGVLRIALEHVATSEGLRTIANPAVAAIRVIDRMPSTSDESVGILVTPVTPLGAYCALSALFAGRALAVLSWEDPNQLPFAVRAIGAGVVSAPRAVVSTAQHMPQLSWRQHALLSSLAQGLVADKVLANKVGVSTATIKREMQHLYQITHASGRSGLAETARRLGYSASTACHDISVMTDWLQTVSTTGRPPF
jgi:hypothetical protein